VSCLNRQGIEELKQKIIEVTLQEKYIGEKVPVSIFCLVMFYALISISFKIKTFWLKLIFEFLNS
jgi:hypothetical protein